MPDSYEDFAFVIPERKRRRWSVILLVVSLIVNVIAAVFTWWTIGLTLEAAAAFTSAPPITHWTGTAVVVFIISSLVALVSALMVTFSKDSSH